MKRNILFISIIFLFAALANGQVTNVPKATGYVNDFENVFTLTEKQSLDSLLIAIEKESTVEIAIVTLDSTLINSLDKGVGYKMSIDSITLLIAQTWKVGKKGKDNGILIGFSNDLRKIRIQNGYEIEKILSDADTKKIIDEIILPCFKAGNYYEGVRKGILALNSKINPGSKIH